MFAVKLDQRMVHAFFRIIPGVIAASTRREVEKTALWVRNELRSRIIHQTFRHTPLKPRYLRWKLRKGLDPGKLMATRTYVNSIQARSLSAAEYRRRFGRTRAKVYASWTVEVPNEIHGPSGLPMPVLARIHEYGSKAAGIPPRPHWRPVWSLLKGKKKTEALKEIRETSRRELRRVLSVGILHGGR